MRKRLALITAALERGRLARNLLFAAGAAALLAGPAAAACLKQPDGTLVCPTPPLPLTTTATSGAIASATAFQTVLAANSARLSCRITNTANQIEYVFFGSLGALTWSQLAAAAIPLAPGQSLSCADDAGVHTDLISIGGPVGATYSSTAS